MFAAWRQIPASATPIRSLAPITARRSATSSKRKHWGKNKMSLMLTRRAAGAAMLASLGAGAVSAPAFAASKATGSAKFEADRKAILAMAGDYHVRFEF